jgi:hypothetical protein
LRGDVFEAEGGLPTPTLYPASTKRVSFEGNFAYISAVDFADI